MTMDGLSALGAVDARYREVPMSKPAGTSMSVATSSAPTARPVMDAGFGHNSMIGTIAAAASSTPMDN